MANQGANIPTTSLIDLQQLRSVDVNSVEFRELLVRLWQTVNTLSTTMNMKDTGYYTETEFINSQYYFPDDTVAAAANITSEFRPVYRIVIDFGALLNTAAKSVAHGLTFQDTYKFTRIYGVATDPTAVRNYIPLPYASPIDANNIELRVDDTNIVITTGSDRTNFTICFVILEYIKR